DAQPAEHRRRHALHVLLDQRHLRPDEPRHLRGARMTTQRAKIKVLTVVGTRPEIIRLAPTLKRLDELTNHVLVHTGQNYDYELNEIFFEDLGLRKPDHFLNADV